MRVFDQEREPRKPPHVHNQTLYGRLRHVSAHWLVLGGICLWFIANTITYPIEHTLWDLVWPWSLFGQWVEHAKVLPKWTGVVTLIVYTLMVIKATRYALERDKKLHKTRSRSHG